MTYIEDYTYFLLIFARMSGCIFFNQIYGRGTLPAIFKISLSVLLTFTVYDLLPPAYDYSINTMLEFAVLILKELLIGYIIGHIISMFFSIVVIGGEVMDMQIGMSMSKIYDPSSNVSIGITGSFLNAFLLLIFFSAGGHISLVQIFITSCKLINVGQFSIPDNMFFNMVDMFTEILTLALKLSLPVMAVEIITEVSIGILMKAIPQIQIFSVNVQLKLIIGLFCLIILVPTFSSFIQNILTLMFENIQKSLSLLT